VITPAGKTKDRALFNATVLELVKLVQAGLMIFGMYQSGTTPDDAAPTAIVDAVQGPGPLPATKVAKLDGLLCDATADGIQRWVVDVGETCVGVEVRSPQFSDLVNGWMDG
jgi:hypothetical protein